MQKMTKLEKQAEALRTRMGTCRIEDFKEVQEEFFRVKKLAEEHRERLNKQKNAKVKHA